ncbi:hypothetical protein BDV28DRAFT_160462 [Aspergillus coremiiformis]|uniref:F-box domain-containing protein n=1 Tax=Aspergillus coremiiformis TaxID=138285 RepID=A0A5N6YX00_9EURO|nr:hypothetical protein BDV28DRAFT_160462 [Aspergillus coremiiformis]
MAQLANLLFELFRLITAFLEIKTLKDFSLVNKRCRAASEHDIFKTIKISFSRKKLLDPLIQHWEYFTSCIYTSQEYARDNTELYTSLRGKSFSYKAIYRHYKALARDQWTIMEERADTQAMTESLPCLLNLNNFKLSFTRSNKDQLLWFSKQLFISYKDLMGIYLETTFMVESMYSMLPSYHDKIIKIVEQGLTLVKSLRLNDSPGMLSLLSSILLPNLQMFEITDCWLVDSKLIEFLEGHNMKLQYVQFQDSRFSDSLIDFWKTISDTGSTGKIGSLTIVRAP